MAELDISKIDTINVGIVGHIDHGKTTLLYRLSGKWADTHSEELKRGITIKLGYADALIRKEGNKLTTDPKSAGEPIRYVTFVDAPGHEMLMATMLSGAAIMDAALLVIAADEGIKAQTREHLVALKAKNINNIIIVQNKIDLVSKDEAIKNYDEIKKFVKGTIAQDAPVIPISAQQGVNIEKLLEALCKIKIDRKPTDDKPIFFVVRSFDINRPGSEIKELHGGILGGALKSGKLKVGDEIEIKPGHCYKKQGIYHYEPIKSRIVSIKKGVFNISEASPGGSLAIETELDPSLTKADSLSGSVASLVGLLPDIVDSLKMEFTLFDEIIGSDKHEKIEEIKVNEMLMLSINTSITVGHVTNVHNNVAALSLKIPVVPIKGESVGIARNFKGHWRLIGFGKIC